MGEFRVIGMLFAIEMIWKKCPNHPEITLYITLLILCFLFSKKELNVLLNATTKNIKLVVSLIDTFSVNIFKCLTEQN